MGVHQNRRRAETRRALLPPFSPPYGTPAVEILIMGTPKEDTLVLIVIWVKRHFWIFVVPSYTQDGVYLNAHEIPKAFTFRTRSQKIPSVRDQTSKESSTPKTELRVHQTNQRLYSFLLNLLLTAVTFCPFSQQPVSSESQQRLTLAPCATGSLCQTCHGSPGAGFCWYSSKPTTQYVENLKGMCQYIRNVTKDRTKQ